MQAKAVLIDQWGKTIVLELHQASHEVDMQLSQIKDIISLFHQTGEVPGSDALQNVVLNRLHNQDGVLDVQLKWTDAAYQGLSSFPMRDGIRGKRRMSGRRMMSHLNSKIYTVSLPKYDKSLQNQTVTMVSDLIDNEGKTLGKLEVLIAFNSLVKNIVQAVWWQNYQAYLVDKTGRVLTSTQLDNHRNLGYHQDPLETETLDRLGKSESGVIIGQRHGATEVSGFYKLTEAPWTLVVFAPATDILHPIFRFQLLYGATAVTCIVLVLILLHIFLSRMVSSIREVTRAAAGIADGTLSAILPVKRSDEIGELATSFNRMIVQLNERVQMKQALLLAGEVQKNLVPKRSPDIPGIDIAGKSIYCDETGGDYFDYIPLDCNGQLGVVIGDVAGHGISSALQMASVRAGLRHQGSICRNPAEMVTRVNRQLCADVEESGQFVTLFFLTIHPAGGNIEWVRAGHDPGILYDPKTQQFENLGGSGIALGIDPDWHFEAFQKTGITKGQVIVLGTDGIWEATDSNGTMFGKDRLYNTIRETAHLSCEDIVSTVFEAVQEFNKGHSINDDITLVAIKMDPE